MKKVLFLMLCVLAIGSFAAAQFVPTSDVLGAHNNGGRGCAGCHAPHSGAGGAGSGVASTTASENVSGDNALFGQDLGPLYGYTIATGGGEFQETFPATAAGSIGTEEVRGIMMCLACHDGSVAKGAMMQNSAYEQRMGLLPAGLYGTGTIPTLLGADGRGTSYKNDHPVGKEATLAAAHLSTSNITVSFDATTKAITNIVPVAGSTYANFVTDYGMPSLAGTPWAWGVVSDEAAATPSLASVYITCTTCHNQHSMIAYKPAPGYTGKPGIAGSNTGTYATYFFVNAPYNVGATAGMVSGTFNNKASSATQFCRQCHFSTSNESYGLNLPTQF